MDIYHESQIEPPAPTRAYTLKECREMFLEQVRVYVEYWRKQPASTDPLSGLAFSILNIIDGTTALPAFRLLTDPHPEDEAYCRENGEHWWPTGADITEGVLLHELFYRATLPSGPTA